VGAGKLDSNQARTAGENREVTTPLHRTEGV
jgi:hypothetical protein